MAQESGSWKKRNQLILKEALQGDGPFFSFTLFKKPNQTLKLFVDFPFLAVLPVQACLVASPTKPSVNSQLLQSPAHLPRSKRACCCGTEKSLPLAIVSDFLSLGPGAEIFTSWHGKVFASAIVGQDANACGPFLGETYLWIYCGGVMRWVGEGWVEVVWIGRGEATRVPAVPMGDRCLWLILFTF